MAAFQSQILGIPVTEVQAFKLLLDAYPEYNGLIKAWVALHPSSEIAEMMVCGKIVAEIMPGFSDVFEHGIASLNNGLHIGVLHPDQIAANSVFQREKITHILGIHFRTSVNSATFSLPAVLPIPQKLQDVIDMYSVDDSVANYCQSLKFSGFDQYLQGSLFGVIIPTEQKLLRTFARVNNELYTSIFAHAVIKIYTILC